MLRTGSENSTVTNYLRQSICGYEGMEPLICCPQTNNVSVTLPGTDVCGLMDIQLRITGGTDATLGKTFNCVILYII